MLPGLGGCRWKKARSYLSSLIISWLSSFLDQCVRPGSNSCQGQRTRMGSGPPGCLLRLSTGSEAHSSSITLTRLGKSWSAARLDDELSVCETAPKCQGKLLVNISVSALTINLSEIASPHQGLCDPDHVLICRTVFRSSIEGPDGTLCENAAGRCSHDFFERCRS